MLAPLDALLRSPNEVITHDSLLRQITTTFTDCLTSAQLVTVPVLRAGKDPRTHVPPALCCFGSFTARYASNTRNRHLGSHGVLQCFWRKREAQHAPSEGGCGGPMTLGISSTARVHFGSSEQMKAVEHGRQAGRARARALLSPGTVLPWDLVTLCCATIRAAAICYFRMLDVDDAHGCTAASCQTAVA